MGFLNNLAVAVGRKADVAKLVVHEQSPRWAIYGGAGLLIGGAFLFASQKPKYDEVVKRNRKERDENIAKYKAYFKEKPADIDYSEKDLENDILIAKTKYYKKTGLELAKIYAVPVLTIAAGIFALVWGERTQHSRLVQTSAALATATATLKNYRKNIASVVGKENEEIYFNGLDEKAAVEGKTKEEQLKSANAQIRKKNPYIIEYGPVLPNGLGVNHEFDEHAPASNLVNVQRLQASLQRELEIKGRVFVSELYNALGIECPPELLTYGWVRRKRPDGTFYSPLGGDGSIDLHIISAREYLCGFDLENEGEDCVSADPIMIDPNWDGDIQQFLYNEDRERRAKFNFA